jgi:hypothetical protein
MSEFKDTNIIIHELEQLFNRDDDIRDILDIKKMKNEIEVQCNAHLKDTKEIIRGTHHEREHRLPLLIITATCLALSEQVAAKEAEIKAPTQVLSEFNTSI